MARWKPPDRGQRELGTPVLTHCVQQTEEDFGAAKERGRGGTSVDTKSGALLGTETGGEP